jgi:hypothetical protein
MKDTEGNKFSMRELFDLMSDDAVTKIENATRIACMGIGSRSENLISIYNAADPTNPDEMCYAGLMIAAVINALLLKE